MRSVRSRLSAAVLAVLAVGALSAGSYAALAVTGRAQASVTFTETKTTNFTGLTGSVSPTITFNQTYTSGSGVGSVNEKWCDRRTIAASGADTIDLAGVVTDEYGAATTFATIKTIMVKADTGNTNDVWIGGAASNRFNTFVKDSSVVVVRPGYALLLAGGKTGYTVTAGTGDDLLFKNSSGTTGVTFEVCLAGTT